MALRQFSNAFSLFIGLLLVAAAPVSAQTTPSPGAPARIAFGPGGNLLVTDYRLQTVQTVDPVSLSVLSEFPVDGRPMGLAYDAQRNWIYVGNESAQRVQVFSPDGTCVNEFTTAVGLPNDIAFDRVTDQVYVITSVAKKVQVFDPDGVWLRSIPADGQTDVDNPVAVSIVRPPLPGDLNNDDMVSIGDFLTLLSNWGPCPTTPCPGDFNQNGTIDIDDFLALLSNWGSNTNPAEIYLSDFGDGFFRDPAVRVYDEQGFFLREIEGDFSRPQTVYAENDLQMFVVDAFLGQVLLVDQATGDTISSLGTYGTDPGQMIMPLGMVIDRFNRDVFVASNRTGRVEAFRQGGSTP